MAEKNHLSGIFSRPFGGAARALRLLLQVLLLVALAGGALAGCGGQPQRETTDLHEAIIRGDIETAVAMVKAREHVNVRNRYGRLPLHEAAYRGRGRTKIAVAMIEAGADPNIRDGRGKQPLHWAIKEGHLETAIALIEAGANINGKKEVDGETPLHEAMFIGDIEIITTLIEMGAGVNSRNWKGYTPLHLAVAKEHPESVSVLIELGASINVKNEEGETPLMLAKVKNQLSIISIMENPPPVKHQKTEINADNSLRRAVEYCDSAGVEESLANGADLENAILHRVIAFCDSPEIIGLFIKAGIDISARDERGRTPLQVAVIYGQPGSAAALIQAGADVNARWRKEEETPLHTAVSSKSNDMEILAALIDAGADVNARTVHHTFISKFNWSSEYDQTPLHIAAREGQPDAVKMLIKAGADVNVRDKNGWTPFDIAKRHRNWEVASILEITEEDFPPDSCPESLVLKERCQ